MEAKTCHKPHHHKNSVLTLSLWLLGNALAGGLSRTVCLYSMFGAAGNSAQSPSHSAGSHSRRQHFPKCLLQHYQPSFAKSQTRPFKRNTACTNSMQKPHRALTKCSFKNPGNPLTCDVQFLLGSWCLIKKWGQSRQLC